MNGEQQYHKANENGLESKNIIEGAFNLDFEIKSIILEDGTTKYFIPKRKSKSTNYG